MSKEFIENHRLSCRNSVNMNYLIIHYRRDRQISRSAGIPARECYECSSVKGKTRGQGCPRSNFGLIFVIESFI